MSEDRTLIVRRLRTGSIFRIVIAGGFFSLVPFAIVMGGFAFFGFHTVTWNNEPLTGLTGLVASPFIGALAAALFSGFFGLFLSFGLWLYSKVRPLTLRVIEETTPSAGA